MLGGVISFIIVVVSQGRLVGLLRGDATDWAQVLQGVQQIFTWVDVGFYWMS